MTDNVNYTEAMFLNHRRRKGSVVGGHHGECGARAYKGV